MAILGRAAAPRGVRALTLNLGGGGRSLRGPGPPRSSFGLSLVRFPLVHHVQTDSNDRVIFPLWDICHRYRFHYALPTQPRRARDHGWLLTCAKKERITSGSPPLSASPSTSPPDATGHHGNRRLCWWQPGYTRARGTPPLLRTAATDRGPWDRRPTGGRRTG